MKIHCQTFWATKEGCAIEEYEDAFAPKIAVSEERNTFRCAVADGATEASFSGLWAQLLVDAIVEKKPDLKPLQDSWHQKTYKPNLAWYAEEKLASGAFAALIALTLKASKDKRESRGTYTVTAVGDSCLFQIRKGKLVFSFPIDSWKEFGSHPYLLSSIAQNNNEDILAKYNSCIEEEWQSGDTFYLMTDAISSWFLRLHQENGKAIKTLAELTTQEKLDTLIAKERRHKDELGRAWLRNDDVTLMRIEVQAD